MNKEELELYNSLLEDGYTEEFAELCLENLVDEERIVGEIIGYFEEIYASRMAEVEEASDGMKDFVSYYTKDCLSDLSPTFSTDEYLTTGLNLLMFSHLEKTAFAIYGGTHFVIFDEEDEAPEESKTFHTLSDFLIFNSEPRKKIIKAIEGFEWKKQDNEKEPENSFSQLPNSMDEYNVAIRWLRDNKDNENYQKVSLLVSQYSYGFQVHRELRECLESMGIEFEKGC